tara:strand:+ start:601 stop:3513 length:2913 start_codon:yes stop_codon:yes gene_type:complete
MNSFTDINVIECNRLHSEEAKSNNNENFALWTNNLQDIVHLNPGDKVSVQGAMVSERGAGQSNAIEIKGESLGITKTYNTIKLENVVVNEGVSKRRIDKSDQLNAVFTPETREIFDNIGNMVINYFVPANGQNYIDLPHRWWYSEVDFGDRPAHLVDKVNFTTQDSQAKGMSLADPFGMLDAGPPPGGPDRWELYDDYYQIGVSNSNASLSKLKKDNSRYTIMIREYTYNSSYSAGTGITDKYKIPPRYLREPENHTYYTYSELKEIKVPTGFNSPEYLATEITRQLQNIKKSDTWSYRAPDDENYNPYTPGFPINITKSISTETYKPFNVAGYLGPLPSVDSPTDQEVLMNSFINASTDLTDGWDYLNQYSVIACKRPEIYETGRLINRNPNLSISNTLGCYLHADSQGDKYVLQIKYTDLDILLDFKNFIEAQEKYPEVFNIFSDTRTPYNASDNIDNSRYVHINRFKNASMTLYDGSDPVKILDTATLGHGGYSFPTWNTSKKCMKSILLPIQYDPSQKDIYYERPDESLGEKTYGFIGRSSDDYIVLYGTKNNGVGSTLFNTLKNGSGVVESLRKIGFDQHFSAPGQAYVLPCDMRTDMTTITNENTNTDQRINLNGPGIKQLRFDDAQSFPAAVLYFGATAPRFSWNGANFVISDLHTPTNRGNIFFANAPLISAPNRPARNTDGEGDVVYRINPREDYCSFTPARKPYVGDVDITGVAKTSEMNSNLEAWRVYDSLTGIMITDFGLKETEWKSSLWGLMGFSYKQFHSSTNTRTATIDFNNINDLSIITTNSEINEGDTKIYNQSIYGVPLFYNRLPFGGTFSNSDGVDAVRYLPEIIQKTQSMEIIADNLPTRMIRGYYTIRSNILQETPFTGGKVNNTTMPIISIVDKINGDGDFYFQQESSLEFTITKPLKLASLTCSIHDPDGSYANVSEQSTILFKVQKNKNVSFNVVQEILQEQQQKK